ncbi:MAG TPA: hypothetical protein VK642_01515 [Burkholderiales bacterium]|nr:hypothetical protein [Burkholderiales bacterium]
MKNFASSKAKWSLFAVTTLPLAAVSSDFVRHSASNAACLPLGRFVRNRRLGETGAAHLRPASGTLAYWLSGQSSGSETSEASDTRSSGIGWYRIFVASRVNKALAKEHEQRYQSVDPLAKAQLFLSHCLEGLNNPRGAARAQELK